MHEGIVVKERVDRFLGRSWLGKGDAPSVYYTTYHSSEFVQTNWSTVFSVIEILPQAIRGVQDLVVLKKLPV